MKKKIPHTWENGELYFAAISGQMDLVKEGLKVGANPNYQEGRTCLQAAVDRGHLDIVECLLQNGADPNLKSERDNITALMYAHDGEMVKLLARYGANPDILYRKHSPLYFYALEGKIDAAKAWVELGWPISETVEKKYNYLLTKQKFDMLTVITGFRFTAENPAEKIAEFRAARNKMGK